MFSESPLRLKSGSWNFSVFFCLLDMRLIESSFVQTQTHFLYFEWRASSLATSSLCIQGGRLHDVKVRSSHYHIDIVYLWQPITIGISSNMLNRQECFVQHNSCGFIGQLPLKMVPSYLKLDIIQRSIQNWLQNLPRKKIARSLVKLFYDVNLVTMRV